MKETKSALKFNLTTVLVGRDGEALKRKPDVDMTLRDAILDAIDGRTTADAQAGAHLSFNGLTRLYCVIAAAKDEVELTAEQITMACDRVGQVFGPGALHKAVLSLINPAALKAA